MRKRAIIVVGGTGYGKTTLLQAIMGKPLVYKKTQAIEYGPFAIDFPGEFCQRPLYYHALVSAAPEAEAIWVLQDATARIPGVLRESLMQMRRRDQVVRGIITKVDLPKADLDRAGRLLQSIGVRPPYYPVSAVTGEGLETLRNLPELRRALEGGADPAHQGEP